MDAECRSKRFWSWGCGVRADSSCFTITTGHVNYYVSKTICLEYFLMPCDGCVFVFVWSHVVHLFRSRFCRGGTTTTTTTTRAMSYLPVYARRLLRRRFERTVCGLVTQPKCQIYTKATTQRSARAEQRMSAAVTVSKSVASRPLGRKLMVRGTGVSVSH